MAKKSEEVKNGLVDEAVENTVDATQHVVDEATKEDVALNQAVEEVKTPGHATRAFRQ